MARRKSGGKKSGGDDGTAKNRGPRFPTEAQLNLARIIADRYRLSLPGGYENDLPWVKMFLDCFAYHAETGLGGSRQLWNIQQWFREQRDHQDIANKIMLTVNHVEFIRDMLVRCGYGVDPVIDQGDLYDVTQEAAEIAQDQFPAEIEESLARRLSLHEVWDREDEQDLIGWRPERDFRKTPSPIRR